MRILTRTWVATLAAIVAVATIGVTPSNAMINDDKSLLAAVEAPEAKYVSALPTTKRHAGKSELNGPNLITIAAGRKSTTRRRTTNSAGQAQIRRARKRGSSQGGNLAITTGQGRGTQADGVFDSQDLIQVFQAGDHNN